MKLIYLGVFVILQFAFCSTISYVPNPGVETYAPTKDVEILIKEPMKKKVLIGKIYTAIDNSNRTQIMDSVIAKAKSVGGHAILVKKDEPESIQIDPNNPIRTSDGRYRVRVIEDAEGPIVVLVYRYIE